MTPFIEILDDTPENTVDPPKRTVEPPKVHENAWGWEFEPIYENEEQSFFANVATYYCAYLYTFFARTLCHVHDYDFFMYNINTPLYRQFMHISMSFLVGDFSVNGLKSIQEKAILRFKEAFCVFTDGNMDAATENKVKFAWRESMLFVKKNYVNPFQNDNVQYKRAETPLVRIVVTEEYVEKQPRKPRFFTFKF
jgi:hypothetical protein